MGRIVPVIQGSAEWAELRGKYRTASMAAVVMGLSPYKTRQEAIREAANRSVEEVSSATQYLFDKGHRIEASCRPAVEEILLEEIAPLTYVDDDTRLLASLDGITEDGRVIWECKSENVDLIKSIKSGVMPDSHWPQLEQQIAVSGAQHVFFTVGNESGEILADMIYLPVAGRIERIIAAWDQFEHDVANYQHIEIAEKPAAGPVLDLPAVSVSVSGQIAVIDNLEKFGIALRDFVDNQLVRDPQTDQDFADLEAQVKTLKKAEDALDAAEKMALSQIESIETMQRMKSMLYKLARDNRLSAEKSVKDQKEKVRVGIRNAAIDAIKTAVAEKNQRLGGQYISMPALKVEEKMKGKKTIQSLHDAANDASAEAMIEINQAAARVGMNLAHLAEVAFDCRHLFADLVSIASKQEDDFRALVSVRIAAEKERVAKVAEEAAARAKAKAEAEQKAKEEAAAESDRQRIEEPKKQEHQQKPVDAPAPIVDDLPWSYATDKPSAHAIIRAVADAFGVADEVAKSWIIQTANEVTE